MGRGRAKAKQTKIARQLKYADHGSDLARLEAELGTVGAAERNDSAEPGSFDDQDTEGQR